MCRALAPAILGEVIVHTVAARRVRPGHLTVQPARWGGDREEARGVDASPPPRRENWMLNP